MRSILLAALLFAQPAAWAGMEICVVEPAIGHEEGKWTYMTGIGPDGAVPNPIEPKNAEVKKVLEKAVSEMNAGVQVCMTGSTKDKVFVVSSARLNPLPAAKRGAPEQMRCGWMDNPTPGNWTMADKDGEWTIAMQGDYRAAGTDDIPDFGRKWVVTNAGSHGYGCACAQVKIDAKEKTILSIRKVKVLPISKCRSDKALPKR